MASEGIRNYEAFAESLRNFTRFQGVSGASDIDFMYVSPNNNVFIMEGKTLAEDAKMLVMPFKQYKALRALAVKGIKVLLVGENQQYSYYQWILRLIPPTEQYNRGEIQIPLGMFERNDRKGFERWVTITINNPAF